MDQHFIKTYDFQKNIRKIFHKNEWWFSLIDIIKYLIDSTSPRHYWSKLKFRKKIYLKQCKIKSFKLSADDGKYYKTDCAALEDILKIIQLIPSPKVELFKLWLAKVGKERIDELNNPEIAINRAKNIYRRKGYHDKWIATRIKGIEIRNQLVQEWSLRGAQRALDFANLTNKILQGAFNLKSEQYKKIKGIKRENLRDHMSDIELAITMLAEAATSEITKQKNSKGLAKIKEDAKNGGKIAGKAREEIEKQSGVSIITMKNFLKY